MRQQVAVLSLEIILLGSQIAFPLMLTTTDLSAGLSIFVTTLIVSILRAEAR